MKTGPSLMECRWLLTILYALHLIWTGLQRCIEERAYKPNALWFCLVTGAIMIAGAFLLRTGKLSKARAIAGPVVALVLGFYLYSFVKDPTEDATMRVGLIILTSVAQAVVLFLPALPRKE